MKSHYGNEKDSKNEVTRFIENDKVSLFTNKGYALATEGKCSRLREGKEFIKIIIAENLPIKVPETLQEAIDTLNEKVCLGYIVLASAVEQRKKHEQKVYKEVGYVVPAEKKLAKQLKESSEKLFVRLGGELDPEGNVTKAASLKGTKFSTVEEVAELIK